MTAFSDTPEYNVSVARRIAEELREEIIAAWREMHHARKRATNESEWYENAREYNTQMAAGHEKQLRYLLHIRAVGLGKVQHFPF